MRSRLNDRLKHLEARISPHFLLHSFGPQAARRTLSETAAALEEDIKFANANSEWLQ
jgi:hypothetical protein